MRRVVAAIAIAAASAASAHAASDIRKDTEAFFGGLACRNAQVLGGQNDIGAILYHDPVSDRPKERSRFGNPVYYLNEAVQPLGIFRILPSTKTNETSRVRTVFSSNGGVLALFDYVKRGAESRFSWSPTDDLVVWNLDELWWVDGDAIRSGFPFLFEQINAHELQTTIGYGQRHVIPEHFTQGPRLAIWNSTHHVLEFEPYTGKARERLSLSWHSGMVLFSDDQLAWTQSDVFVRLTKTNSTNPAHLEVLKFGNDLDKRLPFAPLTFPHNTRLLLLRDSKELKIPEALLLWRDDQSLDHIGMVRLGGSKPTIMAKDYIKKVFVYPDRTKIYGYSDHAGRFHPLPSEQHQSGVMFWLEQLKGMDGIEEFYLLGDGKYAVIKRAGGAAGPEAVILERRGSTTAPLDHLCRTNSAAVRILEGPSSLLFVPKEPAGNALVVYLHDDPFSNVSRSGDWIADIVVRTGTPVLAVNYFGSRSRTNELAVTREIAPMFAKDIEQAVAFARTQLPGQDRKVIFVAHGFGALVGFSSMMAEAVWPERFLVLSGLIESRALFSDHMPDRSPVELNYLARTGRQMRSAINPAVASRKGTRFLFVHGDADEKAAHEDVAKFVAQVNAAARDGPAKLSLIEGMGHIPETQKEYEAIVEAIGGFIRQP